MMKNKDVRWRMVCVVLSAVLLTAGCAAADAAKGGTGGVDITDRQDENLGTADADDPDPAKDGEDTAGQQENGADGEDAAGQQENGADGGDAVDQKDGGADQWKGTAAELGSLAEFYADTLDGGTFTQEDIQDKDVTVINFWSLTCGPCIAEMPDLAAFEKGLPDNVQIVTVCFDGAWSKEETQELLEECGFEGATLIAFGGDLYELCKNIQYTPTTVFVDSEGNLIGDSIIGRQADLPGTYLDAVNMVLRSEGKAEISLEE